MLEIKNCIECKSQFLVSKSRKKGFCPECAHHIYGYRNCTHEFKDSKCIHCLWDGSTSEYVDHIKNDFGME